jgi:uncharacterized protein YhbP (UPF0306 family)
LGLPLLIFTRRICNSFKRRYGHKEIQKAAMKELQEKLELVAALLRQETSLALATTGEDGEPCVAPLFYMMDDEFTLYWFSSATSLHSLNLKRTPRAAVSVYPNVQNWREIRGVQMRGNVARITESKRRSGLIKAYCGRFELGSIFRLAIRRSIIYAFQPEFLRYIDNSKGFGFKFELAHGAEGWSLGRSTT